MASKTSPSPDQATGPSTAVAHRAELAAMVSKALAEMKSESFDVEQQMLDIMEAETIDDILNGSTVLHLADLIGTPMTIHSATMGESKYEDSMLPMYAVIKVEFDDGTRGLVTCGATQVVAALVAAQAKSFFPFRCAPTSATTGAGFDVIKLGVAPAKQR